MSFESSNQGAFLTIKEKYDIDKYKEDMYIGFTGEGDILTIESKSGVIVCINHETLEKFYVNNSIPQLAESLLEYEQFINVINEINGEFAYLDRDCPKEKLELIKNKLINIDNKSINVNSFWWNEISLFE